MADVDFARTFDSNRLVVKGDNIIYRYAWYFLGLAVIWAVLNYSHNIEDAFVKKVYWFIVVPVTVLGTGWFCYKRFFEFRLDKIVTTNTDEDNRRIVLAYLDKEKWEIQDEGIYYISAISSGIGDLQATILFNYGTVLTNVIYYDREDNKLPVLLAGNELRDGIEYRLLNRDNPDAELD